MQPFLLPRGGYETSIPQRHQVEKLKKKYIKCSKLQVHITVGNRVLPCHTKEEDKNDTF